MLSAIDNQTPDVSSDSLKAHCYIQCPGHSWWARLGQAKPGSLLQPQPLSLDVSRDSQDPGLGRISFLPDPAAPGSNDKGVVAPLLEYKAQPMMEWNMGTRSGPTARTES